jgi:hypothetical protein
MPRNEHNHISLEDWGLNTLSGVAKRAAEQRREEVKAWERIRQKRLRETAGQEMMRLWMWKEIGI